MPVIRAGNQWGRGPTVPRTSYRARMAAGALPATYRRHVPVETLFSTVKRTRVKHAHLLGTSYDLARLAQLTGSGAASRAA